MEIFPGMAKRQRRPGSAAGLAGTGAGPHVPAAAPLPATRFPPRRRKGPPIPPAASILCSRLCGPAGSWRLAALFLLLTLPLGVFLAGTVPLGHIADEPAHLMRADGLRRGVLVGHREPVRMPDGRTLPRPGMAVDPVLLTLVTLQPRPNDPAPRAITAEMVEQARAMRWHAAPTFMDLAFIASYMPVFYLPGAAALEAARLAGLPPFQAFILVRLANLAGFAAMGALALRLARRGRMLLFCTLSLPMTLSLAASASQDGLMIAAIALAAALLSRVAEGVPFARVSRAPSYWLAAALLAGFAMAKPPYLPVAGLLLLPLATGGAPFDWREFGRRLGVVALIGLLVVGWMALSLHYTSAPRLLDPYEAGPLWPGPSPARFTGTDVAAQLHVLLAAPRRFVTLPLYSIWHGHHTFLEAVGVLGWLNLELPDSLYRLWAAALAAAALADLLAAGKEAPPRSGWLQPLLLLGLVALAFLGVYLSQYLVWTPVGLPFIGGPQGRYLLPFIPLLALAVPRPRLPGRRLLRPVLCALPIAAAAADVLMLPRLVTWFYYLH
jgi:hypothetical protein